MKVQPGQGTGELCSAILKVSREQVAIDSVGVKDSLVVKSSEVGMDWELRFMVAQPADFFS